MATDFRKLSFVSDLSATTEARQLIGQHVMPYSIEKRRDTIDR